MLNFLATRLSMSLILCILAWIELRSLPTVSLFDSEFNHLLYHQLLNAFILLLAVAIAVYWLWLRAESVRRREVAVLELEERLRRREITEREYTKLRWDIERWQDERNGNLKCR